MCATVQRQALWEMLIHFRQNAMGVERQHFEPMNNGNIDGTSVFSLL